LHTENIVCIVSIVAQTAVCLNTIVMFSHLWIFYSRHNSLTKRELVEHSTSAYTTHTDHNWTLLNRYRKIIKWKLSSHVNGRNGILADVIFKTNNFLKLPLRYPSTFQEGLPTTWSLFTYLDMLATKYATL